RVRGEAGKVEPGAAADVEQVAAGPVADAAHGRLDQPVGVDGGILELIGVGGVPDVRARYRPGQRDAHPGTVSGPAAGTRSAAGACAGTAGRRGGTGATGRYGWPGAGRGSGSPRTGHIDMARSAWAVMVRAGLTPGLALTAAPSRTCRPGWPKTRWYGSMTPSAAVAPMTAPPRMWAVTGTLNASVIDPPGMPPISSASRRAASWPTGIQVGLGAPCPGTAYSRRRPYQARRHRSVIELSRDCMTRAMMVRCDHRRTQIIRAATCGAFATSASSRRGRARPPGTSSDCSRPMALEPGPYRT